MGGDIETLKRIIAAGYPVIIEGTTSLNPDDTGWPDDDLWAAHYLLLTGYDDATREFTVQDTYRGPDLKLSYDKLEEEWKPFNYLYIVVYITQQQETVRTILGSDWDADLNRQKALDLAQTATVNDPDDAFAWFNLGSNLVYFERYTEANAAYDKARELGLPQRMFRYQFGPFLANFHANRIDDLLSLTDYALQRTEMSEETWLWHGWALYRGLASLLADSPESSEKCLALVEQRLSQARSDGGNRIGITLLSDVMPVAEEVVLAAVPEQTAADDIGGEVVLDLSDDSSQLSVSELEALVREETARHKRGTSSPRS